MEGASSRSTEEHRRAERNRLEAGELASKGWKSMTDVAYRIAHVLGQSAGVVSDHLSPSYVNEILEKEGTEYADANAKRLGKKLFLSPDLQQKLEKKLNAKYAAR